MFKCFAVPFAYTMQGKPSRSLQAAWKLISEGKVAADDVVHLERGLYGWYQADLPIDGKQWAKTVGCGEPAVNFYY
jgi:hypothetical protein